MIFRTFFTVIGLLVAWQGLILLLSPPPYILPSPWLVLTALFTHSGTLAQNAVITATEILVGYATGVTAGALAGSAIAYFSWARRWLFPLMVIAPSIPFFAIAPLLVLWFGYGMLSKVAMTTIIIFFPVAASFLDGLRRTEPEWLDLGHNLTDDLPRKHARWAQFRYIRLPAAMPALASGMRVAAAVAPIGAVVGEWVGSSAGLGYLMLHANGRLQIDLLFAALLVLAAMGVTLFFGIDWILRRTMPWQPDSLPVFSDQDDWVTTPEPAQKKG